MKVQNAKRFSKILHGHFLTWPSKWNKYDQMFGAPIIKSPLHTKLTMSFGLDPKKFCINFECYDFTNWLDPTVRIWHNTSYSSFRILRLKISKKKLVKIQPYLNFHKVVENYNFWVQRPNNAWSFRDYFFTINFFLKSPNDPSLNLCKFHKGGLRTSHDCLTWEFKLFTKPKEGETSYVVCSFLAIGSNGSKRYLMGSGDKVMTRSMLQNLGNTRMKVQLLA